MHKEQLSDIAARALELAKRLGASEADVLASESTDFDVKVADGAVLSLSQATRKSLGLRLFVEGRLGFVTTSDFGVASLTQAVERALAMAREAGADPHNGLAEIAPGIRDAAKALDLYDDAVVALSAETKIAWAHALEDAARATDARVRKFRDSGVSTSVGENVLATSSGAVRTHHGTSIALWCNPVAEQDGQLQTEVWYDAKTHVADLEAVESIGRVAATRAARMLGARPIKTQRVTVIFEPAVAAGLIGGMSSALNGDMVYKKASFLSDKLHATLGSPLLTVTDDPHRLRGAASTAFDGEGLPTERRAIIDAGVLTGFFYDTYTARKAGVDSTANAQRSAGSLPHAGPFNLIVEPGDSDVGEIYRSAEHALVVTRGLGQGLNSVSGEYSRGANGLWLEHGEVVHPVQEVTIAGDFLAMLSQIDRVGSDLMVRGSVAAPTLRIADVTVSGS